MLVGCCVVIPCFLIHVDGLLWSHFFSHSKKHGRPVPGGHCSRKRADSNVPVILVSDVLEARAARSPTRGEGTERRGRAPQFNYEPFNSNSVNICSWSWNYRGCWHQTFPPIVTLVEF